MVVSGPVWLFGAGHGPRGRARSVGVHRHVRAGGRADLPGARPRGGRARDRELRAAPVRAAWPSPRCYSRCSRSACLRPRDNRPVWEPVAVTLFGICYVNWLLGYTFWLRGSGRRAASGSCSSSAVTWLGETAAYLVGSTMGRHKLAPAISPRKTVEGAIAQLVMSVLAALGARATFFPALSLEDAIAVGFLLGVVGQAGDLLESAHQAQRRHQGHRAAHPRPRRDARPRRQPALQHAGPLLLRDVREGPGRMKRLIVLGVTGSVGRRTLELVEHFPDDFRVEGMAARGSDPELLAELCRRHRPRALALADASAIDAVARALPGPRARSSSPGAAGIVTLARRGGGRRRCSPPSWAGRASCPPWPRSRAARRVALANKETLVMAGSLMTAAARERSVPLLPVDSEHSAVFQCLEGHNRAEVGRVLLTASGGPFRTMKAADLAKVTVEEALNHPTWRDGRQDHGRLGHAHEQGPRGDRGALALRPPARAGAGGGASAVHRALDGRVRGRLGHRPARRGRHGHPDPLRADVPRAPALSGGAPGSHAGRAAHLRDAGRGALPVPGPGAPGLARRRLRAGHPERGQRGRGGRVPRGRVSASPRFPS